MTKRSEFLMIGLLALTASSGVSHVLVAWLGIWTQAGRGHKHFGPTDSAPQGLIAGSSLTYSALDWHDVASRLNFAIESWPVPGSSPAEWEVLQRRSPNVRLTFVGVSAYDLNEEWLCDFRADVVPLLQTLNDLWQTRADVAFSKRLLSCYPRMLIRKAFPTVGRSQGVMTGLRDVARGWKAKHGPESGEVSPRLTVDDVSEERISAWPRDRLLRRLALMRGICKNKHRFDGPKRLALARLLECAKRQGKVVVLVLPVSRPYAGEFLAPDALERFEAALVSARRRVPESHWVRLDQVAELSSDDCFSDLVHLNRKGREIAMQAFLSHWSELFGTQ